MTSSINDEYTILARAGVGSSSVVYRCIHNKSKLEKAIKIIKKVNIDEQYWKLKLYEIYVLGQLDYPNVLKYFEACEDCMNYYLIMDY